MASDIINQKLKEYQQEKGFFTGDKTRNSFYKAHFSNSEIDDVVLKISMLKYHAVSYIKSNIQHIASGIVDLNIDQELRDGEPRVVPELMTIFKGQQNKPVFFSFCSAYCNAHNPEAYPIYNSFVGCLLCCTTHTSTEQSLNDYALFKSKIDYTKNMLNLSPLNYQEFDKFLWVYSDIIQKKEIIEELNK